MGKMLLNSPLAFPLCRKASPTVSHTWGSFVAPSSIAECMSKRMTRQTTGDSALSDTPSTSPFLGSPSTWPV